MELLLIFWLLMGCLGAWIACQKGRGGGEGFLLGLLFGPIGVLVEALLPTTTATPSRTMTPAEFEALRLMRAARAAAVADVQRMREADMQRAREAQYLLWADACGIVGGIARCLLALALFSWSLGLRLVRCDWFRVLPDWAQAVVIGLAFSVPGILVVARMFRSMP